MGEISAPRSAAASGSKIPGSPTKRVKQRGRRIHPTAIRVLVVGSLNHPKRPVERKQFETACRHLGAALAQRGLTIVVSSLHFKTADVPILKGANDARAGKTPLPVVLLPPTIPRSNDPLYPENEDEFRSAYPNLALTLELLPGQWKEIRDAQAQEADVVVLIGGREGTLQVAWAAKEHGVPIVPIPIFGRAAKQIWEIERAELAAQKRYKECEEFTQIYRKFNADQIADLVLRLAKKTDPSSPSSARSAHRHRASSALRMWLEKLAYFEQQEAISADPAQKFALKKQIEEAQTKIRELGG